MFNPLNLQMNIEVHTGHQVKRQLSPTSTTCDCEVWKHTQRRIISFKINQLAVNLPLKLAAHWEQVTVTVQTAGSNYCPQLTAEYIHLFTYQRDFRGI